MPGGPKRFTLHESTPILARHPWGSATTTFPIHPSLDCYPTPRRKTRGRLGALARICFLPRQTTHPRGPREATTSIQNQHHFRALHQFNLASLRPDSNDDGRGAGGEKLQNPNGAPRNHAFKLRPHQQRGLTTPWLTR